MALAALTITGVSAGGGYLPKIGPSMARLQVAGPRLDPNAVLPPLAMDDEPAGEPANKADPAEEFIGPPAPLRPVPSAPSEPAEAPYITPPLDSAPEAMQPAPEPPLTPQMFMRFFDESGRREAVIEAPVEFTPPQRGPGSSATYIVR